MTVLRHPNTASTESVKFDRSGGGNLKVNVVRIRINTPKHSIFCGKSRCIIIQKDCCRNAGSEKNREAV